jgi:mRNA interferase MazF
MRRRYAPECGDLVWLDFTPQSGHEQAGRRPALVLSPKAYNAKSQLMLCCPITSQVKGYPFEVNVAGGSITGVILADQVKSVDWVARHAKFEGKVAPEIIEEVLAKLLALLGQEPAAE